MESEGNWDREETAKLVEERWKAWAAEQQKQGRETNQTVFAALYGLKQGDISKLIHDGFGDRDPDPPARIAKALTKMLGRIPRTAPLQLVAGADPTGLLLAISDAVALVHQLHEHVKKGQRVHDWKVLEALLTAPAESDREQKARQQ